MYDFPYLIADVIVCVAALQYWYRSRRVGFAWFAAAFGSSGILSLLRYSSIWFPSIWYPSVWYGALIMAQSILFFVFVVTGLHFLFLASTAHDKIDHHPSAKLGRSAAKLSWVIVKRTVFGAMGFALIVAGVVTTIRSFGQIGNGPIAEQNLGVGPGAFAVGLMCLWLTFHRRSPLRKADANVPRG